MKDRTRYFCTPFKKYVLKTSYKTNHLNNQSIQREWHVIDAEGLPLGRLASKVATVLRGKHKPTYSPHFDSGDYVIVLNSNKVRLTGSKWTDKKYISYSGYPGGQKSISAKDLNEKKSYALVENAVRGMLPKNRLGRAMFKKLFVYDGTEHPHQAQNPIELKMD